MEGPGNGRHLLQMPSRTWTVPVNLDLAVSLGEKHTIALVAGGSLSDGVQKGTERSFQAEGPAKQPCRARVRARASPELCDESQAVCCFGPQRGRVGEAGTEVVSMSTQDHVGESREDIIRYS